MKTWEMTVKIEGSTELTIDDVIRKIDQEVNRGDGIYLDLEHAKIVLTK